MATQKQLVAFDWTGAQQAKQDRKLQPGELVELINVRRTEEGPGPIRKRLGFDRTTMSTFQRGTYGGPVTHVEDGGAYLMFRDTSEQVWVREPDSGNPTLMGTDPRCFPRWYSLENLANFGRLHKPIAVLDGSGNVWHFAITTMNTTQTRYSGYQVTVFDATTGAMKGGPGLISIGADSIDGLTAQVDGSGNVWLFWFDHTAVGVIYAHKYTALTPAGLPSPTKTTFDTVTGVTISMLDSWKDATGGGIYVVAIGTTSGTPNVISNYHAKLDTATGQSAASPADVTQTQNGSTNASVCACASGLVIAEHDGSNGDLLYFFWREKDAATDNIELVRVRASVSDLVVDSKTVVADVAVTATKTLSLATSSAWIDGSTEHVVTSHVETVPANWNTENPEPTIPTRHYTCTSTGGSITDSLFNLSTYVVSKPWKVGTAWYLLLGFDDGETTRAQRGYFVYRSDGYNLTTILQGEGAAIFHAGGLVEQRDATTNPYLYRAASPHVVTSLSIGSNKHLVPVLEEGRGQASPDPTLVELDFAATYHSTADNLIVGGVPKFGGHQDRTGELSPISFPYGTIVFTASSGASVASTCRMTVRYAYRRSDGRLHRSAHLTPQSVAFTGATNYNLIVPTLRHTNFQAFSFIEIYSSVPGGTDMFLQHTIQNSPLANTVSILVQPGAFSASGESLDTTGGALDPSPCPPARLAVTHNNRTWLLGTPVDEIWPSLEHRDGRGPEFNETLIHKWSVGTGEIKAAASVDDNTLAIARNDAIALVTGPGPDGLGNGSFDIRTLPGKDGCSNPYAFLQGPLGVYFPRHADGRMCLVTPGGIQEIYQGMEDYVGYTWTGSVDLKSQRQLRFYASNGKILVLDYGHPTPDQPWGQWVLYEGSGLPAAWTGARLINGEAVSMEAGDASNARFWKDGTGFTDNGTSIAMSFTTGRMSPAGMMGEFDAIKFTISTKRLGSGSVTHTITVYNDQDATETHTYTDDGTDDFEFWSAVNRTRDVKLKIQETTVNGEQGRQWDGVVMEVGLYGRIANQRKKVA